MQKRSLIGLAAALAILISSPALFAQEKKDQPAAKKPDAAQSAKPEPGKEPLKPATGQPTGVAKPAGAPGEMTPEMKAGMMAMTPGPMHQKLAKYAGDWTIKSKMAMPGSTGDETDGAAKLSMVLDGRFLHDEETGQMMGMPFKSAKLMGYNNGSKKYEAIWTWTMGTGMMNMIGTSDDDGKTVKLNASFDDAMGKKQTLDATYKFVDDDHFTVILSGGKMPDGSPGPVLESNYTRKK